MTPDPFLAAIEGAAKDAIAQIDAETEKKVAEILDQARKKADEETNRFVNESEQEAKRASQRDINAAQVQAQRAEGDARYELYEDFFRSVANRLIDYRDNQNRYEPVLVALMTDGARGFCGGTVSVDARDEPLARKHLSRLEGTFTLHSDITTAGGCVVQDAEGTVIRDNTFETRLARVRDEMGQEVWSVLAS